MQWELSFVLFGHTLPFHLLCDFSILTTFQLGLAFNLHECCENPCEQVINRNTKGMLIKSKLKSYKRQKLAYMKKMRCMLFLKIKSQQMFD